MILDSLDLTCDLQLQVLLVNVKLWKPLLEII